MAETRELSECVDGVTITYNNLTETISATTTATELASNGEDITVSNSDPPTVGQVLTAVSPTVAMWQDPPGAASGDVSGPDGANDGNVATFDGDTGKLLQDGGKSVAGLVTGPASATSGRIATYADTTGKVIQDSGTLASSVVTGPASSTPGRLATFSDTTGKAIQDSGLSASSVVVGPASSTANRIATFSDTTGKLIQDGGVMIAQLAPTTRTITAGPGLTGGGDLSANLTLSADFGTAAGKVMQGNQAAGGDVTGTLNAIVVTHARGLKSATTTVSVSAATAPSAGQVLKATSSATATWQNTGDVVGPASASDNLVATFDSTTGKLLKSTTTPNLGTPASGNLSNCIGLSISSGVSGLGAGVATFLATPSSANLAAAVTGETGSGALVFGTSPSLTSPTFTTPNLGTPASGTLSNCQLVAVSSISTNTTAVAGTIYLVNTGAGVVTVTLPAAASNSGKQLTVKRKTGSNNCVIDGNASETIDGELTLTLGISFEWATLVCDGAAWFQIS